MESERPSAVEGKRFRDRKAFVQFIYTCEPLCVGLGLSPQRESEVTWSATVVGRREEQVPHELDCAPTASQPSAVWRVQRGSARQVPGGLTAAGVCSKKKFCCTNFEEKHGGRSEPPAHPDRGQLRQLHPQSVPGSCPSRLHFASMSCGATRVPRMCLSRARLSDPYRLEQMCWSASGTQPIVIRNNEGELFQALRDQQAFDSIIISPGPGSPDNLAVCCKPVCCPSVLLGCQSRFQRPLRGVSSDTGEFVQDFGICADILKAPPAPVFGVCLGCQGIGSLYGMDVRRAPGGAVHGRTSAVFHNEAERGGGGLFAGIPSGFKVVRYHSLAICARSPGFA